MDKKEKIIKIYGLNKLEVLERFGFESSHPTDSRPSFEDISKAFEIDMDIVKEHFEWLKNDPMIDTPNGKRMTREIGFKLVNKKIEIIKLKRIYFENGEFNGFFVENENENLLRRYSGNISFSKRDIRFK